MLLHVTENDPAEGAQLDTICVGRNDLHRAARPLLGADAFAER